MIRSTLRLNTMLCNIVYNRSVLKRVSGKFLIFLSKYHFFKGVNLYKTKI